MNDWIKFKFFKFYLLFVIIKKNSKFNSFFIKEKNVLWMTRIKFLSLAKNKYFTFKTI